MARRDRDPRPEIEVWSAEPRTDAEQHVVIGDDRTSRRWVAAGVTVALFVVGVGLLTGGDDERSNMKGSEVDDEHGGADEGSSKRTTTTRRPVTTSTVDPVLSPTGPIFEDVDGMHLLVQTGDEVYVLIDFESGERTQVTLPVADELVPVRDGIVRMTSGEAIYVPLVGGGSEVRLGEARRAVPGIDPATVWLERGPPSGTPSEAILVGLDGRQLSEPIDLPTDTIDRVIDGGLLVQRAGRVYRLDSDGVELLAEGVAYQAAGLFVALESCDADLDCSVSVLDVTSGEQHRLQGASEALAQSQHYGYEVIPSVDRDFVAVSYEQEGLELVLGSLDTGFTALVEDDSLVSVVGWLPNRTGLLAMMGGRLERLRLVNGRVERYQMPIEVKDQFGRVPMLIPG